MSDKPNGVPRGAAAQFNPFSDVDDSMLLPGGVLSGEEQVPMVSTVEPSGDAFPIGPPALPPAQMDRRAIRDDHTVDTSGSFVPGMRPMHGMGETMTPVGPVGENSSLGTTVLLDAGGLALGAYYGGWLGAIAGLLYGGATANTIRAVQAVRAKSTTGPQEAAVSGTYALLGAGLASFLVYKITTKKKSEA